MAKIIINEEGSWRITKNESYVPILETYNDGLSTHTITDDQFNSLQMGLSVPTLSNGSLSINNQPYTINDYSITQEQMQEFIDGSIVSLEKWKSENDSNSPMWSSVSSLITSLNSVDISDVTFPVNAKHPITVLADKGITYISIYEL